MKLDTTNRYLLSIFADNQTFNNDIVSFFYRFQVLCNIYLNIGLLLLIFPCNLVMHFVFQSPNIYVTPLCCIPMVILSLYFLKVKKYNASSVILIATLTFANLTTIFIVRAPTAALINTIIYTFLANYITSSKKIQYMGMLLSGGSLICSSIEIKRIFQVTLDDEQTSQINLLIFCAFVLFFTSSFFSLFQKEIEMDIRNSTDLNFKKVENVTKDVVEVMRSKDIFISTLSHELRNPLNALKGSIDFLAEVIKDHTYLKVLKDAKLSCEILVNLINNVLDAAKLRSDKMEISHEEADVVEIVRKVLTISSKTFERKKLFVRALIDQSIPRKIWIDPSRLLQILMNLISNAIKFTPNQGEINVYLSWCSIHQKRENLLAPFPENTANSLLNEQNLLKRNTISKESSSCIFNEFSSQESEIRQRNFKYIQLLHKTNSSSLNEKTSSLIDDSDGSQPWVIKSTKTLSANSKFESSQKGFLKVQVTDTGCGIDQQNLPKLFGMFEQVAQTARSEYGGTGLGLWICKQLCQKMGGDITIYSEINKGTTFVFYFQIDNDHLDPSFSSNLPRSDQRVRALIVDDQPVNCYLLSLLFEREGIKAQVANGGQEAIDKYTKEDRNRSYNFIILDVAMPDMDGFTVAQNIREWEKKNNQEKVHIYFVSGEYYDEEDIKMQFRKRGGHVDDSIKFLKKPIDGEVLKNEVFPKYKLKAD